MWRSQDPADPELGRGPGPGQGRRAVAPAGPAVCRQLHFPVVCAHPDDPGFAWRLGDGGYCAEGYIAGARLLALIIGGQVRAYLFPVVTAVKRTQQDLGPDIDDGACYEAKYESAGSS